MRQTVKFKSKHYVVLKNADKKREGCCQIMNMFNTVSNTNIKMDTQLFKH